MSIPWPLVIFAVTLCAAALIDTFLLGGIIARAFDEADER